MWTESKGVDGPRRSFELLPRGRGTFCLQYREACSGQDIVNMEIDMLQKLGFRVCQPTAADFFEQYQTVRSEIRHVLPLAYVDFLFSHPLDSSSRDV
eukprot:6471071-Amphidinium_carterae.1